MVVFMTKKLVYGVGINDADYTVTPKVNGKQLWCPFYLTWSNMLERCYDAKHKVRQPTYIGCTAYEEWLVFSGFKAWMEKQDWQGKQLDKDLLIMGNKIYSPDTCVFVDAATNMFITDCGATRGDWPVGVYFNKREGKFLAQCSNQLTRKKEHLGYFTCPNEAHQAWIKRKHELAYQLAELQTDPRVAKALRERYLVKE